MSISISVLIGSTISWVLDATDNKKAILTITHKPREPSSSSDESSDSESEMDDELLIGEFKPTLRQQIFNELASIWVEVFNQAFLDKYNLVQEVQDYVVAMNTPDVTPERLVEIIEEKCREVVNNAATVEFDTDHVTVKGLAVDRCMQNIARMENDDAYRALMREFAEGRDDAMINAQSAHAKKLESSLRRISAGDFKLRNFADRKRIAAIAAFNKNRAVLLNWHQSKLIKLTMDRMDSFPCKDINESAQLAYASVCFDIVCGRINYWVK